MLFFLLCDGGIGMEIFTMECFLNAADLKSLSKAAVKMCITQPALSMQIKKLEAELNVKLINRSSHSFALTEEGRAAYQSFTSIVGAYKDLKWQLEQNRNSQKILRVGYHGPTTWANIPDLFCAFMLLLQWDGSMAQGYRQYMTAMALYETGQSLLLIGAIFSVCIEDLQSGRE